MQRGVSIDTLCADLVAKEIQHLIQDYEKIKIFLVFCLEKLALRGHPAVTRLTVYRWLQVPTQGDTTHQLAHKNVWPGGVR